MSKVSHYLNVCFVNVILLLLFLIHCPYYATTNVTRTTLATLVESTNTERSFRNLTNVTNLRITNNTSGSIEETSAKLSSASSIELNSYITTNITNIPSYETVIDNITISDIEYINTDSNIATSEDFGTIIESDVEENITTTADVEITTATTNISDIENNGTRRNITSVSYGQQGSTKDALKDIAYYLRAYKFNEYDRRYETDAENAARRYFKEFPRPPLRSLHWEVHKHCEPSFAECVDYIRKRIRYVSLKRVDDTAVVIQEQNWTSSNHTEQIKQIDEECNKLKKVGDTVAEPFEGPLERFQWRVTASYYMCWYSMKQVPQLEHLSDHCDNFADCLDATLGPNNKDIRANDTNPYRCALYSFCPDPCCQSKHLSRSEVCWDSPENPCFKGNPSGQRECAVNRSSNIEFRDIVLNRWNVTCRCPAGHEWNSRFGMCVDVDECALGRHNCDGKLQGCVNLKGSFRCGCVWGHVWSQNEKNCIASEALRIIKLAHKEDNRNKEGESKSLIRRITKFFIKSAANVSFVHKTAFRSSILCILLCLF